jgi:hypothetical protein
VKRRVDILDRPLSNTHMTHELMARMGLLVVIIMCGMTVYIAMRMNKQIKKTDILMKNVELCAKGCVQKEEVAKVEKMLESVKEPALSAAPDDVVDNEPTVVTLLPTKKKK